MRVVYVCSSQYIGYTAAVVEVDRTTAVATAADEAMALAEVAADIAIAAWDALDPGVSGLFFFIGNI